MNKKHIVLVAVLALALVLSALVSAQEDQTPFLGVGIDSNDSGALITSVVPDSPADLAGLQTGDIITALNGGDVTAENLADVVQSLTVGDSVTLEVLRDGESLEVQAELAARPDDFHVQIFPAAERSYLGVSLDDGEDGVVIREVEPDSPAAEVGLQANDVLLSINGEAIDDARGAVEAIAGLEPGTPVTLEVQRGDESLTIEATLGSRPGGRILLPEGDVPMDIIVYNGNEERWQVYGLSEDSPLAEAGLEQGDTITLIDGERYNPETLSEYLQELDESAEVTLTIERDGETQEITVPASTLEPLTLFNFRFGQMMPGRPDMPFRFEMVPARLGVRFETLNEEIAQENNLSVTEGALITEVLPDSPAAEAGLQVDDVITAVNGDPVDAERTLRERLLAYQPGDTVTLDVLRGGETLTIEVTLAQPEFDEGMIPFFEGGLFDILPRMFGPDGEFQFEFPDGPARPTEPNI